MGVWLQLWRKHLILLGCAHLCSSHLLANGVISRFTLPRTVSSPLKITFSHLNKQAGLTLKLCTSIVDFLLIECTAVGVSQMILQVPVPVPWVEVEVCHKIAFVPGS